MANEDVRDFLKKIKKESHERLTNNPFWSVERHEEVCNMLDVAIEALQIEPCEDIISRETVKTEYKRRFESSLKDESKGIDLTYLADCTRFNEFIDSIPPVNSLLCEDAVSRQDVLDLCDSKDPEYKTFHLKEDVECLPTVNLQETKTGHWIVEDVFDGEVAYRCAVCGELFWIVSGTPEANEYNFCPKCGTMLVEPQESEDKE